MAEKMMPYALRMTLAVLANKPDDARSISAECVTAMTKELMGVVSRYDLMDFPFMVAALRAEASGKGGGVRIWKSSAATFGM